MKYQYSNSEFSWIGTYPKHWKLKRLKSVFNFISRGTSAKYAEESQIKVLAQACVRENSIRYNQFKFLDEDKISELKGWLKYGDVLISSTGGGALGRVAVFDIKDQDFVADSHITILRDEKNKVNPKYVSYFFQEHSRLFHEYLSLGATNQLELQSPKLKDFVITFPPKEEQTVIVDFLDKICSDLDKVIKIKIGKSKFDDEVSNSQVNVLRQYKKSLIHEVVTGKKQVFGLK